MFCRYFLRELPIARAISPTYILTTFSGKEPYSSINEKSSPQPTYSVTVNKKRILVKLESNFNLRVCDTLP